MGVKTFQFPSNGKAYPKRCPRMPVHIVWWHCFNSLQTGKRIQSPAPTGSPTGSSYEIVSIPFKRESVSKAFRNPQPLPKTEVSIPFKRESVSKVNAWSLLREAMERFNSLQTGKRIQRLGDCFFTNTIKGFQFPSNGKAYPKLKNYSRKLL